MNEDSSKYGQHEKLDGNKTEVFRIYYDKNSIDFDQFMVIEHFALSLASKKKWKIFKAYPSIFIDPYMVCKN
jgi:hypothetical protein